MIKFNLFRKRPMPVRLRVARDRILMALSVLFLLARHERPVDMETGSHIPKVTGQGSTKDDVLNLIEP